MGLKISPAAYSTLLTVTMSVLNYDKCLIYLDDLIIFGRTLNSHNQNLMLVLSRLRIVNLKRNPSKCEFLKHQILYLGHVISSEGILPGPEKYNKKLCKSDDNMFRRFCIKSSFVVLPKK